MSRSRTVVLTAWAAYAVVAAVHLIAMALGADGISRITQPLISPLLLFILLFSARRADRTTVLTAGALLCSWMGDLLPPFVPQLDSRLLPTASFLASLILFSLALAPLWMRNRDPLRYAMAIPYGGIVVGLFLAFARGAGQMLPLLLTYAVMLALMAFLAAGVNTLTWTGGTLFMLSNALLGMVWFLPGAWLPNSAVAVMATYFLGQALLTAGIIQARRASTEPDTVTGPVSLVIVES